MIIVIPALIAWINFRSNNKNKKDFELQMNNYLQKQNLDLDNKQKFITWENSLPSEEYIEKVIGVERYFNVIGIKELINELNKILEENKLSLDDLKKIKDMLLKINLPFEEEKIFPYEIPIIMEYLKFLNKLEGEIFLENNRKVK